MQITEFNQSEIRQLWSASRIYTAWYTSLKRGISIYSRELNRHLTLEDIIEQFAQTRGLLWALGYIPQAPKKTKEKTSLHKELWKCAIKSINYYYMQNKDKVKRI